MKFVLILILFSAEIFSSSRLYANDKDKLESQNQDNLRTQLDKNAKDIDLEITNAKLRAESGAKKKYSFRSSLTYNGGPVSNPLSDSSPDLNTFDQNLKISTLLFGSLGLNYRWNERDNLSFSGSVGIRKPFQLNRQEVQNRELNILNPTVTWSRAYLANYQMFTSASITRLTSENSKMTGSVGSMDIAHTLLNSMMILPIDFGATISSGLSLFKDNFSQFCLSGYTGSEYCYDRRDIYLSFIPFVEYRINDRFSINTSLNAFYFYHLKNDQLQFYHEGVAVQTIGIGYALTRDIYISPYVQFVPQDIQSNRTMTTVSATVNL